MMKKIDWIKYHLENKEEQARISVSDLMPNVFEEYYLIHWNVGIVKDFPFEKYPEKNESIEEINERIRIERKHKLFLNPKEDEQFEQITLKEISNKFKTDYSYQTLNAIKQTPAIKILGKESVLNLQELIERLTKNKNLNFYVDDFFRFPNHEIPNQTIENITIENYIKIQKDLYFDYWTYLFPNDRKWCITTSEDHPMFLGIMKELSEEIKKEKKLEVFKVAYDERLYE